MPQGKPPFFLLRCMCQWPPGPPLLSVFQTPWVRGQGPSTVSWRVVLLSVPPAWLWLRSGSVGHGGPMVCRGLNHVHFVFFSCSKRTLYHLSLVCVLSVLRNLELRSVSSVGGIDLLFNLGCIAWPPSEQWNNCIVSYTSWDICFGWSRGHVY